MKTLSEYGWPIATGLLAAIVVLLTLSRTPDPASPMDNLNTVSLTPRQTRTIDAPVSYADAVRRAAPSVVNIYTLKEITERRHPLLQDPFFRRFFNRSNPPQQRRMQSSLGSGVIVSKDGFILTNHHVIYGADEIITLLYDGREAKAQIVGTDPETDLAVLKIELDNLQPSTWADSSTAQIGDIVLAIGNPFGVGQSVSQGIISATGRKDLGLNTFENFLQTDAAINPGNSGGALIDTNGNLLGINSAILNESSSVGIGFAIPSNTVIKILKNIIVNGRVIRGWLGVETQQLTPQVAARMGIDPPEALMITDVHLAGPAFQSGIKPGDIVTHINGERVSNGTSGLNIIAELSPGDPITLEILRNDAHLSIDAIAGVRPQVN